MKYLVVFAVLGLAWALWRNKHRTPPPTNGDFIGAALLGGNRNAQAGAAQAAAVADDATTTQAVEQ